MPHCFYLSLSDQDFLPVDACADHKLVGFCKECSKCRAFEGWALVEPICRTWTFLDKGCTEVAFEMSRSQLPMMPEAACPLYSLQGATCDPGLIAHFVLPRQADHDIRWLIVYVLLSRVRSLSSLRSVGLTSKIREVIEGGAPQNID